ncbi:MAG TPA: FAD-binding oxidoreductase [Thermohalobaculum sp.]|nr:FAD-binding oxidoreductase [Thermohalobaculum sp.]
MTGRIADLSEALAAIVGLQGLRTAEALASRDPGFHPLNLSAKLAALPRSTAEVAAVVALCRRHSVPIVPQGGRTGLAGGAASDPHSLILMTDRLDRIVEIDPLARIAVVEAGVTLARLEDAAAMHGLSAGIDLAARGSATIGGLIATNAGGMEAFRNGSMRSRLLGLEAVLPDGEVLDDMTRVPKCNEGYDVKQLFCGAEGTLGIVTRAVLRLSPADGSGTTLLAACRDAAAALDGFRRIEASPALALLRGEIMWRPYAAAVAEADGLARVLGFAEAPVYALYEVTPRDPAADPAEALIDVLAAPMQTGGILDAVVAASERERDEIWRVREDSFVIDRFLPHALWYDISVPLAGLDAYVAETARALAALDHALRFYVFGHLGDGNLHITIGDGQPADPGRAKAVDRIVYRGLKAAGGSISAEHGIGIDKRASLRDHTDPQKLRLMALIKRALDPKGLMNPGKML